MITWMLRTHERRELEGFPRWPRWRTVAYARRWLQRLILFPILVLGYSLEVRGRENLRGISGPVLVVSNHCLHLDMALIVRALPKEFRYRLSIAAAARDIFGNPIRGYGSALFGNAFPFAKEGGGVRDSLQYVGHMLDSGYHVLVFPEGQLTQGGPMQPFKAGAALLARETESTVLPIRVDLLRPGIYEGDYWPPRRARVRLTIGEPVEVPAKERLDRATQLLEAAVRDA